MKPKRLNGKEIIYLITKLSQNKGLTVLQMDLYLLLSYLPMERSIVSKTILKLIWWSNRLKILKIASIFWIYPPTAGGGVYWNCVGILD